MVILSDDIFKIDPVKIRDVKVLKTFVGGKLIWNAEAREDRSSALHVARGMPPPLPQIPNT